MTLMTAMNFLAAEMQRLDLLLHREILRLRAAYQLSLDEFRGLYVSDEQVDFLAAHQPHPVGEAPTVQELTARAESLRQATSGLLEPSAPWRHVVTEFGLSPFEQDVLLLALAPEIDLKYETLYAYLNNDVTRKWPTLDLALRLFTASPSGRDMGRAALLPQAPLFRAGLLHLLAAGADRPHWLARGFTLAPPVVHFLLGQPSGATEWAGSIELCSPGLAWTELSLSAERQAELRRIVHLCAQPSALPVLIFEGHPGSGRREAAEAICAELGLKLLRVDLARAKLAATSLDRLAASLTLQQRLLRVGLYLDHGQVLFGSDGHPWPEAQALLADLAGGSQPLFLACPPGAAWRELLAGQRGLAFHFAEPDFSQRCRLWQIYLAAAGCSADKGQVEALANRFILTAGQIRRAITAAEDQNHLRQAPPGELSFEQLVEAARGQSGQGLAHLAVKVSTPHDWDDLVLPLVTLQQVKEIAGAIQQQHVVYTRWGFERRVAAGKGLKVLFAGASGTGKTMTAGVIARDAGLDLYKIDLSSVVSKYIGETEKNLEAIFRAAYGSNAILFFDEADALFGKRSQVKDAHDRYANIEIAYLLQRMEQHEGTVILASNLSNNIDEAFARRMHYLVEFPLPDEAHREKLWRGMFPPQAPLGEDVDLPFLARQFTLAGGDIQNVVLDAAFLAAQDGRVIIMKHLAKAVARQMLKQGRVPSPADFRQYHPLIAEE